MVNSFFHRLRAYFIRFRPLGRCILCDSHAQPELDICAACAVDLPALGPCCSGCALPMTTNAADLCGQCLLSPPPFSLAIASWLYAPPVAQLIAAFKYEQRLSYGETLAKINAKTLVSTYRQRQLPDLITPTPLHWRRHLQRGFNQSDLLAQHYAKQLNIPLQQLIKRDKATPPQQALNAKQRKQNLSNAFSVCGNVRGKSVALVDDVMTTGATATEISRCLLAAGAREVHIWCLARTPD